jgi:hypothetical protein
MIYEVRLGGETAKGLVVAVAVAGGEDGAAWKSRRVAVVRRCLSLLLSMGRWTAVQLLLWTILVCWQVRSPDPFPHGQPDHCNHMLSHSSYVR